MLVSAAVIFMIALPTVIYFGFEGVKARLYQAMKALTITYLCAGAKSFTASICNILCNETWHAEVKQALLDNVYN